MASPSLTFRPATEDDSRLLADLVLGDAEQETTRVAMRLYGIRDIEDIRALFHLTWLAAGNWRQSGIAEVDGEPVGLLQSGRSGLKVTPNFVGKVLWRLGFIATIRMALRLRLQARVSPSKPPGSYVISELHVAPNYRGSGIGQALLRFAEADARDRGYKVLALHTLTSNPAQHLYQRNGFRIVETLADPKFERITGAAGNVLMLKELD